MTRNTVTAAAEAFDRLEAQLLDKSEALIAANEQITELDAALKTARSLNDALRKDADRFLRERDHHMRFATEIVTHLHTIGSAVRVVEAKARAGTYRPPVTPPVKVEAEGAPEIEHAMPAFLKQNVLSDLEESEQRTHAHDGGNT